MKHRALLILLAALAALGLRAADPTATDYTFAQCEGSLTPYPTEIRPVNYPDSLVPVFINHVGRHGARYPASSANCLALKRLIERADSAGTLTALGRKLRDVNDRIITLSTNRWGALDSVGIAEQQAIAARMFMNYAEVFGPESTVRALSSYSPRCMQSMNMFVHQLDRLNNRLTFYTSTGRINSELLRPFDTDSEYLDFRRAKSWEPPYQAHFEAVCPLGAVKRALGEAFPFASDDEAREAAITEYYVIAGMPAMGLPSAMDVFFTREEANALWSCFNLRQYLQRTATTVSEVPADIASALLANILETTDAFVNGDTSTTVWLRFGHAETLMPLLSLMRVPGCYYLTNYFDTVGQHWRDFEVVPMAANLQLILFRARNSGRYYVRLELNEKPVPMRRGDDTLIFPWPELRRYLFERLRD